VEVNVSYQACGDWATRINRREKWQVVSFLSLFGSTALVNTVVTKSQERVKFTLPLTNLDRCLYWTT